MTTFGIRPGTRFPPGATCTREGVNFCIFSRHATRAELLLYDGADSPAPFQVVELDAERHRTFYFWHVFVEGLRPGAYYTWRVDGPADTARTGHRFDPRRELLDPWARAVSDRAWDRRKAADPSHEGHEALRAIVTPPLPHRRAPRPVPPLEGAVVYELHVGGFTRHPTSGVRHPGTFVGLIEKIPYLVELGVTHVELLPVMAFDEQDAPEGVAARGLRNYWGYSTHSYHAPHPRYCIDPARAGDEFRALTRALHDAGLGVILDVVYNHTAEGGEHGPVINFKGLGNETFYHLDAADRRRYRDYTGCGNTVSCNHPLVTAFILRSLEHWVEHLGADGFRFDLASVFARGVDGELLADPPLPWAVETSRVLAPVPVIAEAWDAAGLYHVGAFPGMAWAEWNGRYRDALRRFARGDPGLIGEVASRLGGSEDLYGDDGRLPCNSINFVTCHDGFTLHDLVSYERKHNDANGQDNRDGSDDNASWNCGIEGETDDPAVLALRRRQAKNLVAMLMLSRGVPMLLAGDEVLRTQRGNNNAWCQDNEVSWFDWSRLERERDMLRFTREMIAFRRRHPSLTLNRYYTGRPAPDRGSPDIRWHGRHLGAPDWNAPDARLLAFTVAGLGEDEPDLHAILNMSSADVECAPPEIAGARWTVAVDTSRASPRDVVPAAQQVPLPDGPYRVAARSVVVLEARA